MVALPASTVILTVAFGDSTHIPTGDVTHARFSRSQFALLLVNLWEEAAWAGFLQSRLEHRHGTAADILQGSNRPIAALLAATLLTVVLGICIRTKLRRSYRKVLDEAENQVPTPTLQSVAG